MNNDKVSNQPEELKHVFSVFMVQSMTKEEAEHNGGYHHPTHKATMYISKNGVSIELDSEEIRKVVASARGNFKL